MDDLDNGAAPAAAEGTAAPEPVSIPDEMGQIFDRIEAEEKAATTDIEPKSDDRARGPDGKFIAKEAAPVQTEAAPKITDQPKAQEQQTGATPPAAPESWSAADKAQWSSLPPWAQAAVQKREQDFAAYRQKSEQAHQELTGYRQVLAPIGGEIQRHGVTGAQAVDHLVKIWSYAKRDPRAYLREAAQELGVDLNELTGQGAAQPAGDPEVAALKQEVAQLRQHLSHQHAQAQANDERQIVSHIQHFAQSKDQQGNPLYPHFEAVRSIMSGLMLGGQAGDLKSAYDMATRAHPETWKQLQSQQAAADQAKSQAEAKQRARTAADIQRTNVATKGVTGASPSRAKTAVEEMGEIYDRLHSAA